MKFEFKSLNDTGTAVTHSFETSTWFEALDEFAKFLKGSGFMVGDESIGINEDKHNVNELDCLNITTFSNLD